MLAGIESSTFFFSLTTQSTLYLNVCWEVWFDPLQWVLGCIHAEDHRQQYTTTGSVTLKLYKGSAAVVGRKSPYALYREDISSFESGEIYDHADALALSSFMIFQWGSELWFSRVSKCYFQTLVCLILPVLVLLHACFNIICC